MRSFRILAVVAAFALVASACNGDDDNDVNDNDVSPPVNDVDDNDVEELTLSDVVNATIDEDNASYTLTIGFGSVMQLMEDDNDNGMLNDDDDDDNDNGVTNGNNDEDERAELDGVVHWDEDLRRVTLPVNDNDNDNDNDNGVLNGNNDERDVIITGDAMYIELPEDFNDVANDNDNDDVEWGRIQLADLEDAPTMTLDRDVLVALHNPAAVLQALSGMDVDQADQPGQPGDEVDGRDTVRWTVNVSADDVDDPFFEMLVGEMDNGEMDNGQAENGQAENGQMDNGQAEIMVYVWADEEDGQVIRLGYEIPDDDPAGPADPGQPTDPANGMNDQMAVMVDFDDLGDAEEIEAPEQDEYRDLEQADLTQLFMDVQIVDRTPDVTTPTNGVDDDDDDDNGILDDDDDDDDNGILDDDDDNS